MRATDTGLVTRVRVSVLDGDGRVVEAVEAVKRRGNWWEFGTQVQGQAITAEAWDLPGHVTKVVMEQAGILHPTGNLPTGRLSRGLQREAGPTGGQQSPASRANRPNGGVRRPDRSSSAC